MDPVGDPHRRGHRRVHRGVRRAGAGAHGLTRPVAARVGWFCIYNLALNSAELTLDAGTAAMVVNLAPLMVVVFSGLLLREGFPKTLMVGAPIALMILGEVPTPLMFVGGALCLLGVLVTRMRRPGRARI